MAGRKGITILFFLLLFSAILFLRLPGFTEHVCNPDLGTPSYTARLMLEGQCPYTDAIVSKPPGTPIIYAILFKLFGVSMIPIYGLAALWIIVTTLLLFWIGYRSVGYSAGLIAAAIYGFVQADLYTSSLCPNFEFWSILPAVACLALVLHDDWDKPGWLATLGVFSSLAVLMKQTSIFFLVATFALLFFRNFRFSSRELKKAGVRVLWFCIGACGISLLLLGVMALFSCLASAIDVLNPFQLKTYISSFDTSTRWDNATLQLARFWQSNRFLSLLFLLSLILFIASKRLNLSLHRLPFIATLVFSMAAMFSLSAGGHFYNHYFIVLLPFMCLSVGLALGEVIKKHGRLYRLGILLPVLAMILIVFDARHELKFAAMSSISRVQSGQPLSQAMIQANNENGFAEGHANNFIEDMEWQALFFQASEHIRNHLNPGDTIWTLDYMPELYHYTETFAPTRHQENFEIVFQSSDPNYGLWHDQTSKAIEINRKELMNDLEKAPPRFIVLYAYDCPSGPWLNQNLTDAWPRNVFGDPVGNCKARQEVFVQLQEFLARFYRRVKPPINNGIDLYQLVEKSSN